MKTTSSKPASRHADAMPDVPSSQTQLVVVASGKGGVGKSTLATLVADLWTLAGQPFQPFRVDDQRRLGAMLGARVGTIVPDSRRRCGRLAHSPARSHRSTMPAPSAPDPELACCWTSAPTGSS